MDTLTPAKRSYVMSRVKGKDTHPELIVRRLVYHAGFRYRLCDPRLPGKPDLVFWGKRKVIFVHGCFGSVMKDVNGIADHSQIRNIGLQNWKEIERGIR